MIPFLTLILFILLLISVTSVNIATVKSSLAGCETFALPSPTRSVRPPGSLEYKANFRSLGSMGVEYETMEVGKCWTIYFHKGEYPQPGENIYLVNKQTYETCNVALTFSGSGPG